MRKSFQLIRTNPRLTTNVKIVVDSKYNMYLESFNSTRDLSDVSYKHYLLSIDSMLENDIPKFYNKLPKNIAFSPKSDNDVDVMYTAYENQFDETYFAGADEVEDTWYKEEFEYFAPLYVVRHKLPSNFIIMRIDDPNIYVKDQTDHTIGTLTRENFREEIIDKWKCVEAFDLSTATNLGKFLERNINDNDRFPDYSFFFDTKRYNYSKWAGLEYASGVYRTAEMFLDEKLFYENPHFNLEEFITKGFQENGIIYPYILNLKFLFDDSPATPERFLKYSMNRYYGFYTNELTLVKTITSYPLPDLKAGLKIKNNVFLDSGDNYVNPFANEYIKNDWIQVGMKFYEVREQENGSFRIISDDNLTGYDVGTFNNSRVTIQNSEISDFGSIDEHTSPSGNDEEMYADLYLIEIDGKYHVLKNDYEKQTGTSGETIFVNNYSIQTDYSITSNKDILEYYKGGKDNEFHVQKKVVNSDGSPLYYNIYRVNFSDIKDFDFDRIHTSYSDFDYEKSVYVDTPEEKLYAVEYRDNGTPKKKKVHTLNQDGQYSVMNISSEYSADDETFELRKGDAINPLWDKNQSICKWEYRGSISHSDYPYKLNNSMEFGGVYNRTTNVELKESNVKEKTLDYFYRIGNFYGTEDLPIVDEFDATWASRWSVDSGSWSYDSVNSWLVGQSSGTITNTDTSLTVGKDYYVYIKLRIDASGGTAGIHSDSFDAMSTDIGNTDVEIEGIRKANGSILKVFVESLVSGNVKIISLKVYEITNRYYYNQSTNIQADLFSYLDTTTDKRFNLDYYIRSDFDYFSFFFRNVMYYEDYGQLKEKPYLKYATFGGGDGELPATALFKGVEYKLYEVDDMVLNTPEGNKETIRNIITNGGSKFNEYKMSVILSENYSYYAFDKSGATLTEEDIVDAHYSNFKDLFVSGITTGTTDDLVYWSDEDNYIRLTWKAGLDYGQYYASAVTYNNNLNNVDSYDVEFNLVIHVDNIALSDAYLDVYFICNSFSTAVNEHIINHINYKDNPNITQPVTITLTGVTMATVGELKIEFSFNLTDKAWDFIQHPEDYVKVSSIKVNRKYQGTVYTNPQFQYSYNTSINGLLESQDKNGIHVYLNEKYGNALVIINQNIPINIDWLSLNNIDAFGENHGLYYGQTLDGYDLFPVSGTTVKTYDPNKLTAYHYMDAINNLNTTGLFETYVYYHMIDENGNYGKTEMIKFNRSTFEDLPNWDEKFPPFLLTADGPLEISLKKSSYTRKAIDKPHTNITDRFLVHDNGIPLPQSVIDEPLARSITIDNKDYTYRVVYHGESLYQTITIKRFVGYYEPLFKNIPMYKPIYYWRDGESLFSIGDNYVFADNLEQFAKITELMYSKVNEQYNVLKLKDTEDDRSVYPMVDEIGLSQTDRFIFLSTWDSEFFIKTLDSTTFLDEFITTEIEDTTVSVYGTISASVTSPDPYWDGIKIYGHQVSPTILSYLLTITNTGDAPSSFVYRMKYLSNLGSTGVLTSGVTSTVPVGGSTDIALSYDRPTEKNKFVPYYSEYTAWNVEFELIDNDEAVLDTNDSLTFDVYNNLITFDLSSPTVTNGFSSAHYVEESYDYTITAYELHNRLINIPYVAKLYMETSGGTGNYELLYQTCDVITTQETIAFENIKTPIYSLDYDSYDERKIKFEIYHEYEIEGSTESTGVTFITSTGLTVYRPPEPPNLAWKNPTTEPTFAMLNGGCDYSSEKYNGDIASNCTATVVNNGGEFNGSISVTFSWRADSVAIAEKTITWSGTLSKNDYHIFSTDIGPTDNNGDPYVTYTNKDYTIKASSNRVSGTITSDPQVGFNDSQPNCTT